MKNALILHGLGGDSQENWFPWLKKELETLGYTVWVPNLPNKDRPNTQQYVQILLNQKNFEFNNETVVIGHSSGAVVLLGLLQALPKNVSIFSAYLVGSFKQDLNFPGVYHKELFLVPFDFEEIKSKAKKFIFVHSDDDPYCPLEQAKFLSEKVGGELVVIPGQKHFSVGTYGEKYRKFPELLKLVKERE